MNSKQTKITFYSIWLLCLLVTSSTVVFAQKELAPDLLNVRLNSTSSIPEPNSSNSASFNSSLPSPNSAQTETTLDSSPTDSATENPTPTQVGWISEVRPIVYEQERTQIKQQYRVAAEAYQQSYREYTLAKSQFEKLGTLAALEEAVLDTRQVMLDRNRLLMIFFDLMHLELRASAGLDPEKKQEALRRIEGFQAELLAQAQLIQNSQDRVALAARSQWFSEATKSLRSQGFYIRALILYGRLYMGYQQALTLYEEIKTFHQSQAVDPFMTAQRQRAYKEVDDQIKLINEQWAKIQVLLFDEANRDQNWFQRILPLMSVQQSNLIRVYAFIEELARQ